MSTSLVAAEDRRAMTRQMELADEATYHQIRDQQQAQMTALNYNLLTEL